MEVGCRCNHDMHFLLHFEIEENIVTAIKPAGEEEISGSVLRSNLKLIVKVVKYKIMLLKIAQNVVDIVESVVISLTIVSSRNGLMNNIFLQEKAMKKSEAEVNKLCPLYSNILNLVTSLEPYSRLLHSFMSIRGGF